MQIEIRKIKLTGLISQFADIHFWLDHELRLSLKETHYIPMIVRAMVHEIIDVFQITVDERVWMICFTERNHFCKKEKR
jgi:hypothetical protein